MSFLAFHQSCALIFALIAGQNNLLHSITQVINKGNVKTIFALLGRVHKKHFIYRLFDTLVVEKPKNRETEYRDEKRYLFL